MNSDAVPEVDINNEVDRLFDDTSLSHGDPPRAVILMGGVATGKTTLRQDRYSKGFVLVDAAEMFHHMSGEAYLEFPDDLLEPLERVGQFVAWRAISERRHLVTEIIGADLAPTMALFAALKGAGYQVEMVAVTCDLEETMRRNEQRGDNISAYYAEPFQREWLIAACARLAM